MSKTEWKEYEMSELIEEISMGPFGSNIKVECFTDSGVPVLNGSNLVGFRLNEDSFNYVTEDKATSLGKANAYRGDIVITHRGTLGQIVYIPQNSKYSRYVISQSQFRVRCNEKVIPEYLVYYFHSRLGQHKLLSNASQVGVPSLARPTSTFQKLTISIPPVAKQKEIVKILSSLDDKIELNNAINRNLEEQAQALFKNWFVDFEPFGGKMPPDWKESALKDIVDINPSETLKKGKIAKKIGMDLLEPYKRDASVFVEEPYNGGSKFRNGDTLMARITPCLENGKISMVNILDDGEVGFGSTEYIVFRAKEGKTAPFYVYLLVTSDFVKDPAIKSMVGSSGRQRVQTDVVANLKLVTPSVEWMKKFSEIVEPMSSKITENTIEIQRLISIRDSLLPKLMSGEIDTDKMAV